MKMMKILKMTPWVLLVGLVLIQLVPVDRSNPPVEGEIVAPPEVAAIFERACYDCHSHETVYPWYSRVAPVSWLVVKDIREGRDELNFSMWTTYTAKRQAHKMEEIWEKVEEGEMPLWFYLPLHPEARLSEANLEVFHAWTRDMRPAVPPEAGAETTPGRLGG